MRQGIVFGKPAPPGEIIPPQGGTGGVRPASSPRDALEAILAENASLRAENKDLRIKLRNLNLDLED